MNPTEAKAKQMDNIAELLMQISMMQCKHISINPIVETPYDCYIEFIQKIKSTFPYEEIISLDSLHRQDVNVEQIITPQFAMMCAYNSLCKRLGISLPESNKEIDHQN